jgi:hypothetical protein
MPRKLRRDLTEFDVRTAQEERLGGFENGDLLARAAENFDVLVTLDQRMRYQQNVANLRIGVVVIEGANTRLTSILPLLQQLRSRSRR